MLYPPDVAHPAARRAGALLKSALVTGALLAAVRPWPADAQGPSPTPPAAPPAALTTAEWRADLRTLRSELPKTHRNLYHATPAAAFDSAAAALDTRLPGLARHEIILEMARLVALAGDGHTNISPTRDPAVGFHAFPVALYLFRDGLYVRAADSAHAALVEGRVVRVGGETAEEAYRRVRPYIGRDNEMGARFFAPALLAMPEVLHAVGLAPDTDSARFEVAVGGRTRAVWLHAGPPAPLMAGDTDRSWERRAGWVDARDVTPGPDPLWLARDPVRHPWWFTPVPGTRAVYAQVNQVLNRDTAQLADFAARLFAHLDSSAADRLVLDLRRNRGGNGDLRGPLVRGLLRRPRINRPGGLLVLMGRGTWSAAQFVLDDLQGYSDAVFVGEPSASKGNHYGDSRRFRLPHSGVTVRASSLYWQHWAPDDARPWTAPDVAAEPTMADYRAKRDPALAAALAYAPPARPLAAELRAVFAAGDTAGARARLRAFRADPAHRYADALAPATAAAVELYARGARAQAAAAFALAADEFPDAVAPNLAAGVVYQELGRPALARRYLERVLVLDPQHPTAGQRLKALGAAP